MQVRTQTVNVGNDEKPICIPVTLITAVTTKCVVPYCYLEGYIDTDVLSRSTLTNGEKQRLLTSERKMPRCCSTAVESIIVKHRRVLYESPRR